MCWFSSTVVSRRAVEGEELIIGKFPNGRQWPVSAKEPHKAVCLDNGCKLKLSGIPKSFQKAYEVGEEELVEFREWGGWGRIPDLILFNNQHGNQHGRIRRLPIKQLPVGLRIDVLSAALSTTAVRTEFVPEEPELVQR